MRILFIFLFSVIPCFGFPGTVQDTLENEQEEMRYDTGAAPAPLKFDRDQIAALKEQPEFDYSEAIVEDNWWTKFKRYLSLQWEKFLNWLFGDYQGNDVLIFILKMLPYLIIAGIIIFAVWLFIKLDPGGSALKKPQSGKVFLNEEEEIIETRDIRKLIQDAVSSKNYRLAVRYHYLFILQQLTEADFIDYQFSKTDEEYLAEIKKEQLRKQFAQITRIYDFIWYGNFDVTPENYPRAEKEFLRMQDLIKQKDGQNL